jgi:hypothetical protein
MDMQNPTHGKTDGKNAYYYDEIEKYPCPWPLARLLFRCPYGEVNFSI